MSFVIQGEINIDADGAVRGVSISKKQLSELGGAASKAEANLNRVVKETAGVGRTSQVATGNVGNLAAQFNDIGVMMAAGQSPFQLAIQQGSQITQVLGPMGARGAVMALGSALKSMINPISLITYAAIAGGAALVSWGVSAASAGDEGKTLDEVIDDLAASMDDYTRFADISEQSSASLEDRFGSMSGRAREVAKFMRDWARIDAVDELNGSVARLTETYGGLTNELVVMDTSRGFWASLIDRSAIGYIKEIDNTIAIMREELGLTGTEASTVALSLQNLSTADGIDEQVQASAELNRNLIAVFGSAEQVPTALREIAKQAGLIALEASEMDELSSLRAAYQQYYDSRVEGEARVARTQQEQLSVQAAIFGAYARSRTQSNAATGDAQAMLATLKQQNSLQRLIIAYGEDSTQVTDARAAAERAVFEETLATLDVSEGLKDELRAAFEAGQDLANVDLASGISPAVEAARQLAENLNISLAAAMTMMNLAAAVGPTPGRGDGMAEWQRRNDDAAGITNQADLPTIPLPDWLRPGGGGGGGGGSRAGGRSDAAREAERERQAVEDLVQSLQQELDLSREQDPVLREMIGYRDDLRAATDDERAAIENLIRTRLEEEATLERQREGWDFWGNAALTAINDVDGALEMVLKSLQQAALLGTGPLGALFGGTDDSGKGGLFGMLIDAAIPAKADGGPIHGIGGGREDRQLTWTSPGEYIINARSASQNRMLLDQINYGAPAYADGGVVGGGRSRASGGGFSGSGAPTINVHVHGAVGDRDLEERARQGTARALAEYDADVLPMRMREISNAPERIG